MTTSPRYLATIDLMNIPLNINPVCWGIYCYYVTAPASTELESGLAS